MPLHIVTFIINIIHWYNAVFYFTINVKVDLS